MSNKNDGGPAFPVTNPDSEHGWEDNDWHHVATLPRHEPSRLVRRSSIGRHSMANCAGTYTKAEKT
jgi:hypothetical protein